MKSNPDAPAPLDEIILTPEDRDAMRRSAEEATGMTTEEYLRFLDSASAGAEPSRATSAGWVPFALHEDDHPRR
jgi:hypothetical protein